MAEHAHERRSSGPSVQLGLAQGCNPQTEPPPASHTAGRCLYHQAAFALCLIARKPSGGWEEHFTFPSRRSCNALRPLRT